MNYFLTYNEQNQTDSDKKKILFRLLKIERDAQLDLWNNSNFQRFILRGCYDKGILEYLQRTFEKHPSLNQLYFFTGFVTDWNNFKEYIVPAIKINYEQLHKFRFESTDFTHNHLSRMITTMEEILSICDCWFVHKDDLPMKKVTERLHKTREIFSKLLILKSKEYHKRDKKTFLKIFWDQFEEQYEEMQLQSFIESYESLWQFGYDLYHQLMTEYIERERAEATKNKGTVVDIDFPEEDE